MFIFLIVLFFTFLAIGFPIFMTLILPALLSLLVYLKHINLMIISQRMMEGIDVFSLMSIPFFVLAAEVVGRGMIGKRLIRFAQVLVGHITGGLAMTVILACMIFGAISGAGAAAIVAIGPIVYPALIKAGYGEKFSLGLVLTASTLAMLVPPGIAMILYSIITGNSIGKVFMAGLGVGIFMGLILMIYSYFYAKKIHMPKEKRATLIEIRKALFEALWAMGLPVIIIGGMYSGFYTATEAAGVAAVYAIIIEVFVYKQIGAKDVFNISVRSGTQVAMLFLLIAGGAIFTWIVTVAQVPQMLVKTLGDASPFLMLLMINVIFLIAGMLIDPNSATVILVPVLYPLAMKVGIDPIHLSMVVVTNLAIGMLSPPFGLNIFVAAMVFKIPYSKIVPALVSFIFVFLVGLIFVSLVPFISLYMPKLLGMM